MVSSFCLWFVMYVSCVILGKVPFIRDATTYGRIQYQKMNCMLQSKNVQVATTYTLTVGCVVTYLPGCNNTTSYLVNVLCVYY